MNLLVSKLLKKVDVSAFVTCFGRGIYLARLQGCPHPLFLPAVSGEGGCKQRSYVCAVLEAQGAFLTFQSCLSATPKSLPVFDVTSHDNFDRSGYSQEFISHVLDIALYVIFGPVLWSSLINPI